MNTLQHNVESRFADITESLLSSSSAISTTGPADRAVEIIQARMDDRFTSFAQEMNASLSNISASIQDIRAGRAHPDGPGGASSGGPSSTQGGDLEQLQQTMDNRFLELGRHFDSQLQGISSTLQTTVSNVISSQLPPPHAAEQPSGNSGEQRRHVPGAVDGNVADDEGDGRRIQLPRNGRAAQSRNPNVNLLQVCLLFSLA